MDSQLHQSGSCILSLAKRIREETALDYNDARPDKEEL